MMTEHGSSVAVFYPEDDGYLIDRETTVTHYGVAHGMSVPGL